MMRGMPKWQIVLPDEFLGSPAAQLQEESKTWRRLLCSAFQFCTNSNKQKFWFQTWFNLITDGLEIELNDQRNY
jgi:hypothetical protein